MSQMIPPPPSTISSLPPQAQVDSEASAPLPSAGITLIITNLPSHSTSSAIDSFKNEIFPRIQDRFRAKNPDSFFPTLDMLDVMKGDTRQAVDYVFVSVQEHLSPVPRPDILQLLVGNQETDDAFHISWTTGNGPDRCRRLFFKASDANSRTQAEGDRPVLEAHFEKHNIRAKFGNFTGSASNGYRLSFDFPDERTTEDVLKMSLSVNGHSLSISRPNFVKPLYGWDIVIIGCHGISQFQSAMDHSIRSVLGPTSICHSRMAMNGDAYVVVLENWDYATQLLQSKIPHPIGVPTFVTLSEPMLLYYFNLNNCPSSPRFLQGSAAQGGSSGRELAALNAELQDLKSAGLQMRKVIETILTQQNNIMTTFQDTTRAFQVALSYSQMQMTTLMELNGLESRLGSLRASYDAKDLRLITQGATMGTEWTERVQKQMVELDDEIQQFEEQVIATRNRVKTLSSAQQAALPTGGQTLPPTQAPPRPFDADETSMQTDTQ